MLTAIHRPAAQLALAAALAVAAGDVPAGAQLLRCDDTRSADAPPPGLLASRYHLLQLQTDASARSTNFFTDAYDGLVSGVELRLVAPRLSEVGTGPVPLPEPVASMAVRSLRDLDWEDRADFAVGVEWRPMKRAAPAEGLFSWLRHVRAYASHHATVYLYDRDDWSWRPRGDLRAGLELYRECNLHAGDLGPESPLWAEVWADASWRRTNFVENDFRAWTLAVVPRVGVRLPPGRELTVMPYLVGEIATTQRSEPWQNRVLIGTGVRVMPFRFRVDGAGSLVRGTRVYVEHLWLVDYVEGAGAEGTPVRDLRVGVAVVVNRWD